TPDPIDLIIVPSYTRSFRGMEIAKDLSYVSQSIVAYVDSAIDRPRSGISVCGRRLRNSKAKKRTVIDGLYHYAEIDFKAFREEQAELQREQEQSDFFRSLILDEVRKIPVTIDENGPAEAGDPRSII
ncbi:MAG: hypothetical protein AAGH90_08120, partial [Pseudomonadota bacterium]